MKIGNFLIFRIPKEYREWESDFNEMIETEFFGKPKIPETIEQMVRELYNDLQQRKLAKMANPVQFPSPRPDKLLKKTK